MLGTCKDEEFKPGDRVVMKQGNPDLIGTVLRTVDSLNTDRVIIEWDTGGNTFAPSSIYLNINKENGTNE